MKTRPDTVPAIKRDWINDDGFFIFGKHKGETIEHVARHDPGYIRWIIDQVENITDIDRQILQNFIPFIEGWIEDRR